MLPQKLDFLLQDTMDVYSGFFKEFTNKQQTLSFQKTKKKVFWQSLVLRFTPHLCF